MQLLADLLNIRCIGLQPKLLSTQDTSQQPYFSMTKRQEIILLNVVKIIDTLQFTLPQLIKHVKPDWHLTILTKYISDSTKFSLSYQHPLLTFHRWGLYMSSYGDFECSLSSTSDSIKWLQDFLSHLYATAEKTDMILSMIYLTTLELHVYSVGLRHIDAATARALFEQLLSSPFFSHLNISHDQLEKCVNQETLSRARLSLKSSELLNEAKKDVEVKQYGRAFQHLISLLITLNESGQDKQNTQEFQETIALICFLSTSHLSEYGVYLVCSQFLPLDQQRMQTLSNILIRTQGGAESVTQCAKFIWTAHLRELCVLQISSSSIQDEWLQKQMPRCWDMWQLWREFLDSTLARII